MARKVVVAVDGDTPGAVALLQWAAENLNLGAGTAPAPTAAAAAPSPTGGDAAPESSAGAAAAAAPPPASPGEGVDVTILHATLPPMLPDWTDYPLYTTDKLWEDILTEDRQRATAAAASLAETAVRLHLPATVVTRPGDPRSVVSDYVEAVGADLLVVGSRGLSGVAKLLLGSVSSYLVANAGCSVVVYRAAKTDA